LNSIEENIFYINKIVADLQDYARPLRPHTQETDLKTIIKKVLGEHGIPENVQVTFKVDEEAKILTVDSDYLKRIVSNLALNAVQAMPKGGKLTINAFKDKETGDTMLSVADSGVGIPPDVQEKLFTPMFTTKSKGQGFGLAVVKRLAESLGGSVSFESEVDKGTTFTVRLPTRTLSDKPASF
jgi:signal transduction histidine kinase